ncbi:arylsulfatase [Deltaproteobacteria bacterium TL4]
MDELMMKNVTKKLLAVLATSTLVACTTASKTVLDSGETVQISKVKKPNFITIIIDDMGFSDMYNFGSEILTPNLDAIAAQGTMLTNFYAAPTSTPSRALFFTGKDNHQVGVGNMAGYMKSRPMQKGQPNYDGYLNKNALPFPEVLQSNGYHTIMTGKWDLGEGEGLYAHDRGFDQTDGLLILGGDTHFLSNDQGENITTHPPAVYKRLKRDTIYNKSGKEIPKGGFPPNAFSTTYYTDKAIEMLANRDKSKPFYLNIAHIAPHFPLQAPSDMIAPYLPIYEKGWDVIRAQRFENLKAKGMVPKDAILPPRWKGVTAWDDLADEQKKVEAKKMAIYAGLIGMLDKDIGRLLQHLKDIGEYENTVFLIASDNGAAYMLSGTPDTVKFRTTHFTGDENYDNMGSGSSYIGYGLGWSQVANTPFNNHKGSTFDGGIRTPAIIHYPKATNKGNKDNCIRSIMDIAPTILDMSDIDYPDTYNGNPNPPMLGVSMAGIFDGSSTCDPDRQLFWELDGVKGVRKGDWTLSQERGVEHFYLYNLKDDPFELNDLSNSMDSDVVAKYAELKKLYAQYATDMKVVPVPNDALFGD